jgi:hypothetical protein
MDASGETLLIGDAGQQIAKRRPFVGIDRGEQGRLVGPRHGANLPQQRGAVGRELDFVYAAVGATALPADQTSLVEVVDERDEAAWEHAETFGQGLLALSGCVPQQSEDPD